MSPKLKSSYNGVQENKDENKYDKIHLKDAKQGARFAIWNREFTVLREYSDAVADLENAEPGVFVIQNSVEEIIPFNGEYQPEACGTYPHPSNDFRWSFVREYLNNGYIEVLEHNGSNVCKDVLEFDIDLTCTLGQHEYGVCKSAAGLLTLHQYGLYHHIIPKVYDAWMLATPWQTPLNFKHTACTQLVWVIGQFGYYDKGNVYIPYGVRPTLTLSPKLLVQPVE